MWESSVLNKSSQKKGTLDESYLKKKKKELFSYSFTKPGCFKEDTLVLLKEKPFHSHTALCFYRL